MSLSEPSALPSETRGGAAGQQDNFCYVFCFFAARHKHKVKRRTVLMKSNFLVCVCAELS